MFSGTIEILTKEAFEFVEVEGGGNKSQTKWLSKLKIRNGRGAVYNVDFSRVRVEYIASYGPTGAECYKMMCFPGQPFWWPVTRKSMRDAFDKGYIRVVEQD